MNLGHRVGADSSLPIRVAIVNQRTTVSGLRTACERWVTKVTRLGIRRHLISGRGGITF
jgi:hypothetical protein